jgi:hypothetical protein
MRNTNMRNIEAPELAAEKLTELLEAIGIAPEDTGGTITITGEDPFVASPHRIGTTTAVALSAIGAATAAIWKMRSGRGQDISVDAQSALHALRIPPRLPGTKHLATNRASSEPQQGCQTDREPRTRRRFRPPTRFEQTRAVQQSPRRQGAKIRRALALIADTALADPQGFRCWPADGLGNEEYVGRALVCPCQIGSSNHDPVVLRETVSQTPRTAAAPNGPLGRYAADQRPPSHK